MTSVDQYFLRTLASQKGIANLWNSITPTGSASYGLIDDVNTGGFFDHFFVPIRETEVTQPDRKVFFWGKFLVEIDNLVIVGNASIFVAAVKLDSNFQSRYFPVYESFASEPKVQNWDFAGTDQDFHAILVQTYTPNPGDEVHVNFSMFFNGYTIR